MDSSSDAAAYLKIGDKISLYCEEYSGYFSTEGHDYSHIREIRHDKEEIPDFENSVFEIQGLSKYSQQKSGSVISYGQVIKLRHFKTNRCMAAKNTRVSDLERDCMKVEMDSVSSKETWIKILPRYKVRSIGEKVRVGDHVLLFSVTNSLYLHASRHKYEDGAHEVNMSSAMSTWRVDPYLTYVLPEPDRVIQGGHYIALLHKEANAFLGGGAVEELGGDERVYLEPVRENDYGTRFPHHSFWLVELESARAAGVVGSTTRIRLKHAASGKYLALSSRDELTTIESKRGFNSDDTLFHLVPVNELDEVAYGQFFQLQHVASERFIHNAKVVLDGVSEDETRDPSSRILSMRKVVASTRSRYEDALQVFMIDSEEIMRVNNVINLRASLEHYITATSKTLRVSFRDAEPALRHLTELIMMCSESNNDNPLTREGAPLPLSQLMLRDQRALITAMEVMETPVKAGLRLRDIFKPEFANVLNVTKMCARMLRQAARQSAPVGLYIYEHLFSRMLPFLPFEELGMADAVAAMLDGNRDVLHAISDGDIAAITRELPSSRADVLALLCVVSGEGVTRNQSLLAELLIRGTPPPGKIQPLQFREENGLSEVLVKSDDRWVNIEDFAAMASDADARLLRANLRLYAAMCAGRNYACIELLIEKVLPYAHVVAVVTNAALPDDIRALYMDLLAALFVDRDPQEPVVFVKYSRVWQGENPTDTGDRGGEFYDLGEVKEFVLAFIQNAAHGITEERRLTLSVVRVVELLLRFGFFSTQADVAELLPALVRLLATRDLRRVDKDIRKSLERRTSLSMSKSVDLRASADVFGEEEDGGVYGARLDELGDLELAMLREDEGGDDAAGLSAREVLVETKVHVCRIIRMVMDLRLDVRLGHAVDMFAKFFYGGLATVDARREAFDDALRVLEFNNMLPVLLELVTLRSVRLNAAVFPVIFREHAQRREILRALRAVNLVISDEDTETYFALFATAAQLRTLASGRRFDAEKTEQVKHIFDDLAAACRRGGDEETPNTAAQNVLRTLGVHDIVLDILHMPFRNDLPRETATRDIFVECYRFLRALVYKNAANQAALFPHVSFFHAHARFDLKVAPLVTEVFRGNLRLALQVDEAMVRDIVHLIATRGMFPRYLRLLQQLVVVDGQPVKQNQTMVMNALVDAGEAVVLLFKDRQGRQERAALIKSSDHVNNPDGLLNYHIELVRLMYLCTVGYNFATEVKCQSLLTTEDVMEILLDRDAVYVLKEPFLQLLLEVYFIVEEDVEIENADDVWALLELLNEELADFVDQSEAPHDTPENRRIPGSYVFDAVIPFLTNVFVKFSMDHATREQVVVANALLDAVCRVAERVHLTSAFARSIVLCIRNMTGAGLGGSEYAGAVQDLLTRAELTMRDGAAAPLTDDAGGAGGIGAPDEPESDRELRATFRDFVAQLDGEIILHDDTTGLVEVLRADASRSLREELIVQLWRRDADAASTMDVLTALLASARLDGREALQHWQRELNSAGATEAALALFIGAATAEAGAAGDAAARAGTGGAGKKGSKRVAGGESGGSADSVAVARSALSLLAALLDVGGAVNRDVQRTVTELVRGSADVSFLRAVQRRLVRGRFILKSKKHFLRRHATRIEEREGEGRPFTDAEMDELEAAFREQFEDDSLVMETLVFVQLLCEGHNAAMQNYLREQPGLLENVNVVVALLGHAMLLDKYKAPDTAVLLAQCFATMAELAQGPNVENQRLLVSAKAVGPAMAVLRPPKGDFARCAARVVHRTQLAAAEFLLSLLQGHRDSTLAGTVLDELDLEALAVQARALDEDGSVTAHELLHRIFVLTRVLGEEASRKAAAASDAMAKVTGAGNLDRDTAHVEILKGDHVERVYFTIPHLCRHVTDEDKDHILFTTPRDTPKNKLMGLLEHTDRLFPVLQHRERIENSLFLAPRNRVWQRLAFFFVLVTNVLLLIGIQGPPATNTTDIITWEDTDYWKSSIEGATMAFGALASLCIVMYTVYDLGAKRWTDPWIVWVWDNRIPTPHLRVLYDFIYFLLMVLAWTLNMSMFAFHLLDIVSWSLTLRQIFRAVLLTAKRIFAVIFLIVVAVYLFSVLGFFEYRLQYGEGAVPCRTLWQCTLTTLHQGLLRYGGVKDDLTRVTLTDPFDDPFEGAVIGRIGYDIAFFLAVVVFGLGTVLALIIDAFHAQREMHAMAIEDLNNRCFVSGIERDEFDKLGAHGFSDHVSKDQNIWHYMYFVVHLKLKSRTDYTGQESYVAEKLAKGDLTFFPVHHALVFERRSTDDRIQSLEKRIQNNAKLTQTLSANMEKILQTLERMSVDEIRSHAPASSESQRRSAAPTSAMVKQVSRGASLRAARPAAASKAGGLARAGSGTSKSGANGRASPSPAVSSPRAMSPAVDGSDDEEEDESIFQRVKDRIFN